MNCLEKTGCKIISFETSGDITITAGYQDFQGHAVNGIILCKHQEGKPCQKWYINVEDWDSIKRVVPEILLLASE